MYKNIVLLLLLSGFIGINCQSKEKEECVSENLRQCSNQYNISQQFYPSDNESLKQHCSLIEQKDQCFRNNWMVQCNLTKRETDILNGRFDDYSFGHFKDVCNVSTTYSKLFVKYGKCLNLTFAEQNKCHNKYKLMTLPRDELLNRVKYMRNDSREEKSKKVRQICCWWTEYQTCIVRAIVDRCGEQAAILVNEEFYRIHTSSATSRILTYKSCLPIDRTFRFPVCLLDKSVDPNLFGTDFEQPIMGIEDNSRRIDIEETIVSVTNSTDSPHIGASAINGSNSSDNQQILKLILISILYNFILK